MFHCFQGGCDCALGLGVAEAHGRRREPVSAERSVSGLASGVRLLALCTDDLLCPAGGFESAGSGLCEKLSVPDPQRPYGTIGTAQSKHVSVTSTLRDWAQLEFRSRSAGRVEVSSSIL